MKKYFQIYKEFFATGLAEAMSFRAHFVLVIVMDLLFYASTILSVEFIYRHVEMVGIWHREQFLFYISFMLVIDHIHMAFVSENFWNFSFLIRTGKLDFELLRPANPIFTLFFRHIRVQTILITPVPWGALIYFGNQLQLTLMQWLQVPILILLGLALLISIEILVSLFMFYTVESFGINFLRMQLQQLSRWPDFAYRRLARLTFSVVIPILLVGSAPVRYLLEAEQSHYIIGMVIALLATSLLVRFFWTKALRSYESASS